MRYLISLCNSAGGKKEIKSFEVETDKPIRDMKDAEELKLKISSWAAFGKIDIGSAKVIAFSKFED